MPNKITKLKRRNLLGETPDQEKARYRKVAKQNFKKTNNPTSYLNLPYTTGATNLQLERRKKILRGERLPIKPVMTIRQRKRLL